MNMAPPDMTTHTLIAIPIGINECSSSVLAKPSWTDQTPDIIPAPATAKTCAATFSMTITCSPFLFSYCIAFNLQDRTRLPPQTPPDSQAAPAITGWRPASLHTSSQSVLKL